MNEWISIPASDGQSLKAWLTRPHGAVKGGLVIAPEIFGVNAHIRDVADGYAAEGYAVLAPAFFDPVERGVELEYDSASSLRGRELVGRLGLDAALDIVASAAAHLRSRLAALHQPKAVGTVGYCWGGTVAMLANARQGLTSVTYYGGRSVPFLGEPAHAPMLFHFGEKDSLIPPEDVQKHREHHPDANVHTYPAGHGFNCDERHDYAPESAALAWERTTAFLKEHLR